MSRPGRMTGVAFLGMYRWFVRGQSKAFSLMVRGAFAEFGSKTVLEPPLRVAGEARIALGTGVYIGGGSWLQALGDADDEPALVIGDGTAISGNCVISAARSVVIGRNVLMAKNVYISDHGHSFEDPSRPVLQQGISEPRAVQIDDGAWLGENVVICPGVHIGRGAVIGANAVVLDDVPAHSVAVGVPARVTRRFADEPALEAVP